MTDQHSYEGTAGVPETDYDELLYRITANHEHPVMRYVRELPFESAVYPAIEYLRLHPQDGSEDDDQEWNQEIPSEIPMQEGPEPYRQYISWCMPAHDTMRPDRKGCDFIRSSTGGIVYSACPEDADASSPTDSANAVPAIDKRAPTHVSSIIRLTKTPGSVYESRVVCTFGLPKMTE